MRGHHPQKTQHSMHLESRHFYLLVFQYIHTYLLQNGPDLLHKRIYFRKILQ